MNENKLAFHISEDDSEIVYFLVTGLLSNTLSCSLRWLS